MRTEFRFSGQGGQGIITLGKIYGRAATLYENKNCLMTEAYGPEVTGGFAKADLIISDDEIDYPMINNPDYLVVMSEEGWQRDSPYLKDNTVIFYEKDLVKIPNDKKHKYIPVPAFEKAFELGNRVVANVVMMGVIRELTEVISQEDLEKGLLESIPKGTEELNLKAIRKGFEIGSKLKGGKN